MNDDNTRDFNPVTMGDRVRFKYKGVEPFTGEYITGEVISEEVADDEQVLIYRDEPWRHADAMCTSVSIYDLEIID